MSKYESNQETVGDILGGDDEMKNLVETHDLFISTAREIGVTVSLCSRIAELEGYTEKEGRKQRVKELLKEIYDDMRGGDGPR